MVNFQDGLLLPHLPDLSQKPGSLKQEPCRFFSLLLMEWFNKFKARSRLVHTMVEGQLAVLSVFSLTNPKLGEVESSLTYKTPAHKKGLDFPLSSSPSFQRVFYIVCLLHACVSSPPIKSLFSTFGSICSCL